MPMTATRESEMYETAFDRLEKVPAGEARGWLLPIRKAAMARFSELGFPTLKHQDWTYTNVAPIAGSKFTPAGEVAADVRPEQIAEFTRWDTGCPRLVFVNGRFSRTLSSLSGLPDGIKVTSLSEAFRTDAATLEKHLAQHAEYQTHAFRALNTAFIDEGAFIHIPKGKIVERPIHVVYVTAGHGSIVSHPRNLIVVESQAQATIVETYAGLHGGTYFSNVVSEVVAADGASVFHYKVVRESDDAFHIGTVQLHQYRSSHVSSHVVSMGGGLVRHDINAVLDGEGADSALDGLYVLNGTEHVDNHLQVDHVKPHCNSREYFKGVLDGKSRGVFTGRINVHKDAQKTDAKQTNKSLLLSPDAFVDSKPQLEIFADDVKCTHGATIGQMDDEAIFYLRSRGLNEAAAKSLLIFAFANESLERIRNEPLQQHLKNLLFERLPHGEFIRES